MTRSKVQVGQRYGRLTVLSLWKKAFASSKSDLCMAHCRCDCGTVTDVHRNALQRGLTRSCGCLQREVARRVNTKHGHCSRGGWSHTFTCYRAMISRCYYKSNASFPRYGALGITVCDRWLQPKGQGFLNFLEDMGEAPSADHSIDRRNNSKGYSPDNCRWATRLQQAHNKDSYQTNHPEVHDEPPF